MGVGSESLAREDVIARLHHSGIVDIDVGNIYPCAHEMRLHVEPHVAYDGYILLEKGNGLDIGVESASLGVGESQAMEERAIVGVGSH